MNPVKKFKLKAMLRNCDYILAGTVIKQKYYSMNKGSEFNRLIDQYMDDPGFANAVKLIEYNEMTVFYFTESCGEGLYARKTLQDGKPEQGDDRNRLREPRAEVAAAGLASHLAPEEEITGRHATVRVPAIPSGGSSEPRSSANAPAAQRQSILAAVTARAAEEHNKREAEAEAPAAAARDTVVSLAAARQAVKPAEAAQAEPSRFDASHADASRADILRVDVSSSDDTKPVPAPAIAVSEAEAPFSRPEPDYSPGYANVVATLKIDIETMTKQLDHYRKQLPYRPLEADRLKAWCESLESAIREFTAAVKKLEGK